MPGIGRAGASELRPLRAPRPTWTAAVVALALAAALVGCDSGTKELASAELVTAGLTPAEQEQGAHMRITDIEVTGPAAAQHPGTPNRIGSDRIRVRAYEPVLEPGGKPWATLVWAHGGSFLRGTLDWPEADWVSRQFADAGIQVYSVDYILASDTVQAPAPSNDVAAVLSWAAERAEPEALLAIGGASAGAHLATLAALDRADRAAAGDGRVADALILEYPTMHRVQLPDPAIAAATAGLPEQRRFSDDRIAEMYAFYLGAGPEGGAGLQAGDAPVAGELPAERLAALPPTTIVNADADDLRASGEQFAEQLRAAGVPVTASIQPGTVHGYLNRPEETATSLVDAEETIDRFVIALRQIAAG
ncbi:alpha/beta hydrolase fold domain-containing protein [Leucobacter luti]|uniref:alpha/beta hydrolase fold domain-containing protein n=1 Tax=Leucobacter luti TaxID=340320 RepID=UPI001FB65D29|nr:alpha/beta hydrolase fold domain-containing protein [Leucobacter luti]